jgi:hypothetical protein
MLSSASIEIPKDILRATRMTPAELGWSWQLRCSSKANSLLAKPGKWPIWMSGRFSSSWVAVVSPPTTIFPNTKKI